MIACFLSNISAKYYKNLSMLCRVIAKNVGATDTALGTSTSTPTQTPHSAPRRLHAHRHRTRHLDVYTHTDTALSTSTTSTHTDTALGTSTSDISTASLTISWSDCLISLAKRWQCEILSVKTRDHSFPQKNSVNSVCSFAILWLTTANHC